MKATFTRDEQGEGHFYGHAAISARMADDILLGLKAPNALREEVVWLVKHHMDRHPLEEKTARRLLSRHGLERMEKLLDLQTADMGDRSDELEALRQMLRALAEKEGTLTLKTLAVKGADLMALGLTPGPILGQTLNGLLEKVLAGELPNEKKVLLDAAFKK